MSLLTPEERAELERLRAEQGDSPEPPGVSQTLAAGAGERLLGNAAGLLNLPTTAANAALAAFERLNRPLTIGGVDVISGTNSPQFPPVGFRFGGLDLPSGRELASAIESPIQAVMAGQSMADAFGSRMEARQGIEEARPALHAGGRFLGDVGTIATGRAPLVSRLAPNGGGLMDGGISNAINASVARLTGPQSSATSRTLGMIADSDKFRSLMQGAGRAAETGIEGAALSILQNQDPVETAAYAAGGQAMTSLLSEATQDTLEAVGASTVKKKMAALAIAGAAAGGAWAVVRAAVPGGDANLVDDFQSGFNKVALAGVLGAMSEVIGGRPSGTSLLREFPEIADAIQTIPRTGIIKLAQAAADDPELQTAMRNAPALGVSDSNAYLKAVDSDDPGTALKELMESNTRIRRILTAPDIRLATVPVRED